MGRAEGNGDILAMNGAGHFGHGWSRDSRPAQSGIWVCSTLPSVDPVAQIYFRNMIKTMCYGDMTNELFGTGMLDKIYSATIVQN